MTLAEKAAENPDLKDFYEKALNQIDTVNQRSHDEAKEQRSFILQLGEWAVSAIVVISIVIYAIVPKK
ncbi:MAG: hypothetical protein IJR65_02415 [Oscillospiraceae bacterium]|nr:hypothetical protein [Oscillospiraceae bacterium]